MSRLMVSCGDQMYFDFDFVLYVRIVVVPEEGIVVRRGETWIPSVKEGDSGSSCWGCSSC